MALGGCAGGRIAAQPVEPMARATVEIETGGSVGRWAVEIAETARQREVGLAGRDHLPAGTGMLFLFQEEQSPTSGFWMYGTRVALDIAFVDAAGTVVAVRQMTPCRRFRGILCPRYRPGAAYQAAIEVPAGELVRAGVGPGSVVRVLPRESLPGRP